MGQHEAAREATKRAIKLNPTLARAQANLALDRYGGGTGDAPGDAIAPRPADRRGRRARALQSRTRASGRRAITTRRCASTAWRSRPGRTAGSTSRRWPRCTCSAASWRRRWSSTSALVRDYPDSAQAVERAWRCLHQAGRRAEAIASYEQAVAVDRGYQLAWNNLGVVRAHEAGADAAIGAFREALEGGRPLFTARLNLGLLLLPAAPVPLGAGRIPAGARRAEGSAVAWNGVGLVLMELRRFEDARNAFGRAVDADPDFAGGPLQPELRAEPARRLRRRAAGDPARAGARAALRARRSSRSRSICSTKIPTIAIAPELSAEVGGRGARGRVRFDAAGARSALRGARAAGAGRRRNRRGRATRSTSPATTSPRGCSTWPRRS